MGYSCAWVRARLLLRNNLLNLIIRIIDSYPRIIPVFLHGFVIFYRHIEAVRECCIKTRTIEIPLFLVNAHQMFRWLTDVLEYIEGEFIVEDGGDIILKGHFMRIPAGLTF